MVENPLGGKKLSELLARARKIAVITENQFRHAPSDYIVPWLLAQIRQARATPSIVIGCGKMAVLSAETVERKFGREVVESGGRSIGFDVYESIEEDYGNAMKAHGSDAGVAFVPCGRYTVFGG